MEKTDSDLVIYRHSLEDAFTNETALVEVPKGQVLKIGMKEGRWLNAWVLQRPDEKEKMTLRVVGTGWTLDTDFQDAHFYLGTGIGPVFVWHVFQRRTEEGEAWARRERLGQPHPIQTVPL